MEMIKLRSDVQVLNRPGGVVQVGLAPGRACRLQGANAELIRMLDGTKSLAQVVEMSADPSAAQWVMQALAMRGLLEDTSQVSSPDAVMRAGQLRSRMSHLDIRIHGGGRLGMTLALLLAGEGITSVRVSDSRPVTPTDITPWGASRIDIGLRRDRVAALLIERMHRGALDNHLRPHARGSQPLDVVVCDQVADWPWFNPSLTDALIAGDVPHIVVAISTHAAALTSVIEPGRTPCLRCGHHSHTDNDPDWPLVADQLARRATIDTASLSMILLAAAATMSRISQWCRGEAQQDVLIIEADGTSQSSPVAQHPMCGCGWNAVA